MSFKSKLAAAKAIIQGRGRPPSLEPKPNYKHEDGGWLNYANTGEPIRDEAQPQQGERLGQLFKPEC